MQLEPDERIVYDGGIVLFFRGFTSCNGTDRIFLTNKRVFTKVWIPLLNLFIKGLNMPLKEIISVKKTRWVFDDSLLFEYKENSIDKQRKICFKTKEKRDDFYKKLRELSSSICY